MLLEDIFYIIADHLSLDEAKELFRINDLKLDMNRYFRSASEKIDNSLKAIFGNDYSAFTGILKENKVIISGSFVLQHCINEFYSDTDIDIYLSCEGDTMLSSYEKYHEITTDLASKINAQFID